MGPSESLRVVGRLERLFPVDEWCVDGVHVWPILRMQIAAELHRHNAPPRRAGRPILRRAWHALRCMAAEFPRRRALYRQADCLVLGDMAHRCRIGDGWFSKDADALVELLQNTGKSVNFLENSDLSELRLPRLGPARSVFPELQRVKLRTLLHWKFSAAGKVNFDLDGYDEFLSELRRLCPTASWGRVSLDKIRHYVLFIRNHSRFFRSVIDCVKPSAVFVVCYYNLTGMALCHAAKGVGVPVYDLQHGIAGEFGRAYGQWRRLPAEGFNTMPSGFWCWTARDAAAIREWSQHLTPGSVDVVVGGNLWAAYWLSSRSETVQREIKAVERFSSRHLGKKKVLVTLQNSTVPEVVLKAIETSVGSDILWLIRCHPVLIDALPSLASRLRGFQNVEIETPSRMPLFALVPHVDVHVTEWSACVEDCALFNVPSVVIHPAGRDLFRDQITDGSVAWADGVSELLSLVEEMPREVRSGGSMPLVSTEDELRRIVP